MSHLDLLFLSVVKEDETDLSSAIAAKLSTVTEQKSLWRNLMALQRSSVCSHQQQRGLAPNATSKGTHARLAQSPEHARFLMKRLVTVLNTLVQQVHHSTVALPIGSERLQKITKLTFHSNVLSVLSS